MNFQPEHRGNAEELLRHPWIQQNCCGLKVGKVEPPRLLHVSPDWDPGCTAQNLTQGGSAVSLYKATTGISPAMEYAWDGRHHLQNKSERYPAKTHVTDVLPHHPPNRVDVRNSGTLQVQC